MSENPSAPSDPNGTPPHPASGDSIPVAKPASGEGSGGVFGPRPIFEIEEDRCPKCGIPMPSMAVVCVKCGYDQRANVVREVQTGVVEAPVAAAAGESPAAAAGKPDFVVPTRLDVKPLAIAGAVLTVAAMVAAGYYAPVRSFWPITGWVLLTLYSVAVNAATGVAAVAVAARVGSQPFGRLDLALARMFAAFALFQAVSNTRPSLGYAVLTSGVPFLIGAALYFGSLMLLFRKDRREATLIAMAHFILWLLLQLGPVLAGWVAVAPVAAKPA